MAKFLISSVLLVAVCVSLFPTVRLQSNNYQQKQNEDSSYNQNEDEYDEGPPSDGGPYGPLPPGRRHGHSPSGGSHMGHIGLPPGGKPMGPPPNENMGQSDESEDYEESGARKGGNQRRLHGIQKRSRDQGFDSNEGGQERFGRNRSHSGRTGNYIGGQGRFGQFKGHSGRPGGNGGGQRQNGGGRGQGGGQGGPGENGGGRFGGGQSGGQGGPGENGGSFGGNEGGQGRPGQNRRGSGSNGGGRGGPGQNEGGFGGNGGGRGGPGQNQGSFDGNGGGQGGSGQKGAGSGGFGDNEGGQGERNQFGFF